MDSLRVDLSDFSGSKLHFQTTCPFVQICFGVCLCMVVFTGAKIAYVRWGVPPAPPEPQAEPVAEPEPVENVGQGQ